MKLRPALALGAAALSLAAVAPAAIAAPPSANDSTTVSATVNSRLQVTAPADFSFGDIEIGATKSVSDKQVTVVSNVRGGYQLSITRTEFTFGDIPLAISAAAAPAGASLDIAADTDVAIPSTGSLDLGDRSASITPSTGDVWVFGFKLGEVPFVQDGEHSSTLTISALGL